MRLDSLQLARFGPFTDVALDFSAGREGLHVVFGPNEAGKSSTLRALRALLYGIPQRTSDNFVHAYDQLRIGGVLQRRDGATLEIIRRKSARNTLRAADDQTPIADEALEPFLGGVDEATFQAMFGIDHKTLVAGGQAIISGKGRIGELLFAAGAGLVELHRLQEGLQQEIDGLYKPQGQKPKINEGLRQLREVRQAVKDVQLSVDEWARHDSALAAAEAQCQELTAALSARQTERVRLDRINQCLPAIGRWRQEKSRLENLQSAPLLPAGFSEQRASAVTALDSARRQKQDAEQTLEELAEQIAALNLPQELLEAAEQVEHLREGLGSHRKAMHDRPGIERSRAIAQAAACEILKSLGTVQNLEQAETLRLPRAKVVRIQTLANRQAGLAQALESALEQCERVRRKLKRIEDELARMPPPADLAPLRATVDKVQAEGFERQQTVLLPEIRKLEDDARVGLAKLSLPEGSLEQVERLNVPSEETIARFDEQMADSANRLANLCKREAELVQTLQQCAEQLAELESHRGVPSAESLDRARQRRQQGWELILDEWKHGRKASEKTDRFVRETPGAADLAQAFERSVEAADLVADRLRTEADAIAKQAGFERHREQTAEQLESLRAELLRARAAEQDLLREWSQCWSPAGVAARTPKEMSAWLRRQRDVAQLAGQWRAKRLTAETLREQIAAARAEVHERLSSLDGTAAPADLSLSDLLRRSQDRLIELQSQQNRRDELSRDRAMAMSELAELEANCRASEVRLADWNRDWTAAMQELRLAGDATTEQAHEVLDLNTRLFQHLHQMSDDGVRIDGIDHDAKAFTEQAEDAARRLAPGLIGRPVEVIVAELGSLLTSARKAQTRLAELGLRRDEELKRRDDAERELIESTATLAALCREAGCDTGGELPEVEHRSHERRQTSGAIAALEEQILSHSGGLPLEPFLEQSKSELENADGLPARIAVLDDEIAQLSRQREDLLKTVGSERGELARMTGSSEAAAKAQEQEGILAALDENVHQLAVLRLAGAVLRTAIERYRQQNQGPILERAGSLFATLSARSFADLRADFDDDGQPILVGLRPDGTTVRVAGMSDGTADQLYLALRLASLEHWFAAHEPIPFIVDDILLNFDERRAAAAIGCLADISDRVQVILFTHHEHVVRLAETHVGAGRLFLHELPRAEQTPAQAGAHEFAGR